MLTLMILGEIQLLILQVEKGKVGPDAATLLAECQA